MDVLLTAYTPPGGDYPPYFNISRVPRGVSIAVRSASPSPQIPGRRAEIVVEPSLALEHLRAVVAALEAELEG